MMALVQDSRTRIQHPGAAATPRRYHIEGFARSVRFAFRAGETVGEAVARGMEESGADAAAVVLDGLLLTSGHYVTPDGPKDSNHVAWYSEQFSFGETRLRHGTAMVGRKNGDWFLHCHAVWHGGDRRLWEGHMLCDQLVIGEDRAVEAMVFAGGSLEATADPETNFTLFRLAGRDAPAQVNAALITIRPHEDLRATIDAYVAELGIRRGRLFGLGSIIGAEFHDAPPMTSPLSEILLLADAHVEDGRCAALPLACIDDDRNVFIGDLKNGHGPILFTAELLLVNE